jgi:putative addiction module component (TIGR02574 family)
MSPTIASLLAAAEALSPSERRELIELLAAGLDDPPPADTEEGAALSEAWRHEVAQRSAEYDAGQAQTVPWEQVKARWKSRRATGG